MSDTDRLDQIRKEFTITQATGKGLMYNYYDTDGMFKAIGTLREKYAGLVEANKYTEEQLEYEQLVRRATREALKKYIACPSGSPRPRALVDILESL